MSQAIIKHLEALAKKEPDERRQALESVLAEEGISYTTQEEGPSKKCPFGVKNYLYQIGTGPSLLFCAHYDSAPGSSGANDNASSVCILIELAKQLQREGFAARFAFFDAEEYENGGSKLYVSLLDPEEITGVVNLDVCGYGDQVVVYGKGNEKKPVFASFTHKPILEKYRGSIVKYLPPSDNDSFSRTTTPAISIAAVPYWDIQYLKTLASYGGGLLGRPPEFYMILGEMDVITTMHGGAKDGVEWVEADAMQRVYDYIYEAIHTKVTPSRNPLKSLFKR